MVPLLADDIGRYYTSAAIDEYVSAGFGQIDRVVVDARSAGRPRRGGGAGTGSNIAGHHISTQHVVEQYAAQGCYLAGIRYGINFGYRAEGVQGTASQFGKACIVGSKHRERARAAERRGQISLSDGGNQNTEVGIALGHLHNILLGNWRHNYFIVVAASSTQPKQYTNSEQSQCPERGKRAEIKCSFSFV